VAAGLRCIGWRDVDVHGFTAEGLPDARFQGRWAARNATFCDLIGRRDRH